MKYIKFLALICLVASSQLVFAAETAEHRYTSKERITFSPATRIAFDRSGKLVTHKTLADGSKMSEHNGSMGNVTVARMGPDGEVETYCTSDESAAKAWMAGEFGRKPATSPSMPVRVK